MTSSLDSCRNEKTTEKTAVISRHGSESDHEAAIHYEDCTGAAYRIRKGVSKTPLQVSLHAVDQLL